MMILFYNIEVAPKGRSISNFIFVFANKFDKDGVSDRKINMFGYVVAGSNLV